MDASPVTSAPRHLMPVTDLTGHPGNVREDLNLTDEFKASVAAEGVRIPLLITAGPITPGASSKDTAVSPPRWRQALPKCPATSTSAAPTTRPGSTWT